MTSLFTLSNVRKIRYQTREQRAVGLLCRGFSRYFFVSGDRLYILSVWSIHSTV